jgi:HEXXH motif-containing protein
LAQSGHDHLEVACALCEAGSAFQSGAALDREGRQALQSWKRGAVQLGAVEAWIDLETGSMRPLGEVDRVAFSRTTLRLAGGDAVLGGTAIDGFPKVLDDLQLRSLQERIRRTSDWLVEACPGFEDAACSLLRSIVPMQRTSRGVPSASTNAVVGAVCITDHDEVAVLAEQIVHEASHGFLFLLQEHDPLLDPAVHGDGWDSDACYSPWRDDPRPLAGLLHGALVFSRVACMHAAMLGKSDVSRARLQALVPQLEIADELLSIRARWTPLGQRMKNGLHRLLAHLKGIASDLASATDPLYLEASSILETTGSAAARQLRHRTRFMERHA